MHKNAKEILGVDIFERCIQHQKKTLYGKVWLSKLSEEHNHWPIFGNGDPAAKEEGDEDGTACYLMTILKYKMVNKKDFCF